MMYAFNCDLEGGERRNGGAHQRALILYADPRCSRCSRSVPEARKDKDCRQRNRARDARAASHTDGVAGVVLRFSIADEGCGGVLLGLLLRVVDAHVCTWSLG